MLHCASNRSDISSDPSASARLCRSTRTREQLSTRSRLRTYFSNSGVRIPLRYPEYSPMPKPRAKASNIMKDFLIYKRLQKKKAKVQQSCTNALERLCWYVFNFLTELNTTHSVRHKPVVIGCYYGIE